MSYQFSDNDVRQYVNAKMVRNKVKFEIHLQMLHMINTEIDRLRMIIMCLYAQGKVV